MKYYKLILSVIFLLQIQLNAQTIEDTEHDHYHKKNEIGISNGPVFFLNENEFANGMHVHYIRSIGETKLFVGLGYERIFDEHKHNSLGFMLGVRPIDSFGISLSPGITSEDNSISDINFGLHFEVLYEFEIDNIHIGPVLGFAYDPEDYHISLGFHIGIGF